jgi:hypothetical protein
LNTIWTVPAFYGDSSKVFQKVIVSKNEFLTFFIFFLSANQLRQAEGEREDLVLRRRHSLRGRVGRQRLLQTFSQNGKHESEWRSLKNKPFRERQTI